MLRIIIAGSRFFEDYNLFESTMFKVLFHLNKEYPQYNILVINKVVWKLLVEWQKGQIHWQ